jgi:hypothetical protein
MKSHTSKSEEYHDGSTPAFLLFIWPKITLMKVQYHVAHFTCTAEELDILNACTSTDVLNLECKVPD